MFCLKVRKILRHQEHFEYLIDIQTLKYLIHNLNFLKFGMLGERGEFSVVKLVLTVAVLVIFVLLVVVILSSVILELIVLVKEEESL